MRQHTMEHVGGMLVLQTDVERLEAHQGVLKKRVSENVVCQESQSQWQTSKRVRGTQRMMSR